MPTLLLFNIAPQKRAALQVIGLRCGCRMQAVPTEAFGATMAQLLSGETTESASTKPFTGELLVMAGLNERQLDTVLTELRRRKVHIPLKAVLTPTNADWTAAELYTELCRERDAIAQGRQAHE
jgi:hypothetical protein